jgi:hypothetical protein
MNKHFVERVVDWNNLRYTQEYDKELLLSLLDEEINEFFTAITEVDQLDALIDIIYISIGGMWKMGLTKNQIVTAINIVCDSNDTKSISKTASNVKANINKGVNYQPPEPQLEALLDERRN